MRFIQLLAAACLTFSTIISAQQLATNAGAINGEVTDSSGAPIPGVKVTITSPALQGQQVFTTNEQGNYRFPDVPIGLYRITYEASGFATIDRRQVNVTLGFTVTINTTMTPSTQQQTVVVTGETPLVDTAERDRAGRIQSPAIERTSQRPRHVVHHRTDAWNDQPDSGRGRIGGRQPGDLYCLRLRRLWRPDCPEPRDDRWN